MELLQSIHHLGTMMVLSQCDGSVDSRRSAESSRSEPRIILANMQFEIREPSMLKNGSLSWSVISRGPNRHVDDVFEEIEEAPHDQGMVSGTSIEESIAANQQEQSSPPINPL